MRKFYILIFLILISCSRIYSQSKILQDNSELSFKIGMGGGYLYSLQKSSFSTLPGIPNGWTGTDTSSMKFEGGKGSGFYFGAFIDKPIINDQLSLGLNISYVTFKCIESIDEFIGFGYGNNSSVPVIVSHYMETKFDMIRFTPNMSYQILQQIPIKVNLGIDVNLNIQNSFNQYESINSQATNAGINFSSIVSKGGTHWNSQTGNIPNTSNLNFGGNVGLGYEYQINRAFSICADISYGMLFTSLNSSLNWKNQTFAGGIKLSYSIYSGPKYEKPVNTKDSIKPDNTEKPEDLTVNKPVERLDNTQDSLRKIEEQRIKEAEQQRIKEAEEKRFREAEEKRIREAEEKRLREAEEKRIREAEEKRIREAEEKRLKEIEEQRIIRWEKQIDSLNKGYRDTILIILERAKYYNNFDINVKVLTNSYAERVHQSLISSKGINFRSTIDSILNELTYIMKSTDTTKYKCCMLRFISTSSRAEAQKVLDFIRKQLNKKDGQGLAEWNLINPVIDEFYDFRLKKTFYIVCSICFEYGGDADELNDRLIMKKLVVDMYNQKLILKNPQTYCIDEKR